MVSAARVATWIAVGALALNALLLGAAGLAGGRPRLLVGGGVAALAAVAVLLAWRRHRRALAALAQDRRAMRDEAIALRDQLRRGP